MATKMSKDFTDMEPKRTVANLVVECLEKEGVRYVLGVPGEETGDLLFTQADSPVCFVPCRHEQAAAFIADVWGRLTATSGSAIAHISTDPHDGGRRRWRT
jgi:thiamine pyrophosphate-dependent acetolactate synthase large subunit-like protein